MDQKLLAHGFPPKKTTVAAIMMPDKKHENKASPTGGRYRRL